MEEVPEIKQSFLQRNKENFIVLGAFVATATTACLALIALNKRDQKKWKQMVEDGFPIEAIQTYYEEKAS